MLGFTRMVKTMKSPFAAKVSFAPEDVVLLGRAFRRFCNTETNLLPLELLESAMLSAGYRMAVGAEKPSATAELAQEALQDRPLRRSPG